MTNSARFTPYEIEIILHHNCSKARFPRENAPLYGPTLQKLAELDLIEWENGIPVTTARGQAFVELLCATPIPIQRFVDPRFETEVA